MTGIDARPGPTDSAEYAEALVAQNAALADLVRTADLEAQVPTCPEWTIRKLAAHVGRGDRWAATIVGTRAQGPVDPRTVADGAAPREPDELAAWVRGGAAALVDAVESTGADTPVWTFTGPKPAGWWLRRRLHEATVHRADAAIGLGADYTLAPELAADGLGEWLDLLTARPGDALPAPGTTIHLHATDDGLGAAGEWLLRTDGDRFAWEHGHAKATVAVRGPATALFLALLRRVDAEDPRLEILGERDVVTGFLAATPF